MSRSILVLICFTLVVVCQQQQLRSVLDNTTISNFTGGRGNMTTNSSVLDEATIADCSRRGNITNVSSIFKSSLNELQLKPFYVLQPHGLQSLMDEFFTEVNRIMGVKINLKNIPRLFHLFISCEKVCVLFFPPTWENRSATICMRQVFGCVAHHLHP